MERMSAAAPLSRRIARLRVGEHQHLDEVSLDPPVPASLEWLPLIDSLVDRLLEQPGDWAISLPLGTSKAVPTAQLEISEVFAFVDPSSTQDPPSVHRLSRKAVPSAWQGETHTWEVHPRQRTVQLITFSRSEIESRENCPYSVAVTWKIRGTSR